jgi:L-ascorbate metabolism protein UlaG (beta-lactamase superfamily)
MFMETPPSHRCHHHRKPAAVGDIAYSHRKFDDRAWAMAFLAGRNRRAASRPAGRRGRRVVIGAVGVALLLAALGAYVLSLPQFGGRLEGDRLARARANPQYRDGGFVNPRPPAGYRFADVRELLAGQFLGHEVRVPPGPLPVVPVAREALQAAAPAPGLRAFWIGHASVYLELDGVRLLVDPIFSEHASPFDVGPRRFHPPPIALADLPPIDAVLITHDHYDHLDMRTIQALAGRGATFVVPLGIGAHLQHWGVPDAQLRELEWWREQPLKGLRVVSTPSRHYSGRGLRDRNATLWTSWTVIGTRHRLYVSGDTGYSEHFREIGERFGPFDLAFIKIGAYGPGAPWLDIHMSPEDAVRAHVDLRARRLFPVHWATFNLAFHDWDEPIRRTLAAARAGAIDVLTPRIGEWVDADRPFAPTTWWEGVR